MKMSLAIRCKQLLTLLTACSLTACLDYSATPVNFVDLERYMGKWYQISANETNFNKGLVGVTAEYTLKDNGTVDVYNRAYKGSFDGEIEDIRGTATVVDTRTNAKLNVTFPDVFNAPVPGGNYWILVLDQSDYQYAAVADPLGFTLFILSRTPNMDESVYQSILSALRSMGVETNRLKLTPQPDA